MTYEWKYWTCKHYGQKNLVGFSDDCIRCREPPTETLQCVDCGTTEGIIYMKPGEERCKKCAEPIFEQLKKDRATLKENRVGKALAQLKEHLEKI